MGFSVALIDADQLDYYHRLERERIHLLLIDDAKRSLADIAAGRTYEADGAIGRLQRRRAADDKASSTAKATKKRQISADLGIEVTTTASGSPKHRAAACP